jgi:hypothetical protein
MSIEVISAFIGFILTLMIFSYLIGDNPLFRVAVYLFIGVSSGYAAAVVWHSVLMPKLFAPLSDPNQRAFMVIPLILAFSLLAKLLPRFSWIGNFAMALMVGVGAAIAIGGALFGTLIPQAQAAMEALNFRNAGNETEAFLKLIEGVVMLIGTVLTLAYFQFSAKRAPNGTVKRNGAIEISAQVGRIFIAVTLGVLFAGVYMAVLTAMIERLSSMFNLFKSLLGA